MFSIMGSNIETALCRNGVHINAVSSQYLANKIVDLIVAHYQKEMFAVDERLIIRKGGHGRLK